MFSKISRYRKLADVVTVDVQGRQLASKELRLLPSVTGAFRHTVNAGDRLDQLAYKYYDQPRKWWRICDANPQFLSPLALLGQEVVTTLHFPLTAKNGSDPAWAALISNLRALPGVEDVVIEEEVTQAAEKHAGPPPVTIWKDVFTWAVQITCNQMQVDIATILQAIKDAEFEAGEQNTLGQLGQAIVIPQDVIG
jgi:hypothetical protein